MFFEYLIVNQKWPYALSKPLNHDIYIGLDVHDHYAGFLFFYRNGEKIVFDFAEVVNRTGTFRNEKIIAICRQLNRPVVLLGGNDVKENGSAVAADVGENVYNACGATTLDESVFLVSRAEFIIGFDTGLTHIAEAFNKPIASIWGSTVPELLGVQPYKIDKALISGVSLSCRPCSKYGLAKCPLNHFKCLNEIDEKAIVDFCNE